MPFDFNAWFGQDEQDAELPMIMLRVNQLEHTRRVESKPLILALLRHTSLTPKVAEFCLRLINCGRWTFRHDRLKPYRYRCEHPLCPSCQPLLKVNECERVLDNLNAAAHGKLDWRDLSWVTINGPKLPLGSDFGSAVAKLKTKIRNVRGRYLRDTLWSMGVHIAVQSNGDIGMAHLHGIVWHPGLPRRKLREVLGRHFRGEKVTCVKPLKSPNLKRHFVYGCGSYMADQDLRMNGYRDRTPVILAKLIHSYETVRTNGRMGLRFEIGFTKGSGCKRDKRKKAVRTVVGLENDQNSAGHYSNNSNN